MGVGVSNWRLSRAVALQGQLGVISGTGIDTVISRRMQLGDPDGGIRRALAHFPWPDMAERALKAFYIEGGKPADQPYKLLAMPTVQMGAFRTEMIVLANFVEIFLAKEGHNGLIGINYLEKIQLPTLPSLFGAMLAGVDYILMGAGIPITIPPALDGLARWQPVQMPLFIENAVFGQHMLRFDPDAFSSGRRVEIARPKFLPIVSSDVIAKTMCRKAQGTVDGFVIENHTAGGHNAPPRRDAATKGDGSEPRHFGPRDEPDLAKIRDLKQPFWLAGGYASPEKLKEARAEGATGVQIGTAFAFCQESGILPEIKQAVFDNFKARRPHARTDFQASPTGYPFKILAFDGTGDSPIPSREPKRVCDLGYLRHVYCEHGDQIAYRCPAEPIDSYIAKGGTLEQTENKVCLCNGLLGTIGLGQLREDGPQVPLVTIGEDLMFIQRAVENHTEHYTAKDVLDYMLS
jgi:NAD(P)H-dependent flavin oxidoreductase YrpB (nitropropane dioxygenase family)